MGCGCSSPKSTSAAAGVGGASLTILIIGLDNSGKTTLARTVNGGGCRYSMLCRYRATETSGLRMCASPPPPSHMSVVESFCGGWFLPMLGLHRHRQLPLALASTQLTHPRVVTHNVSPSLTHIPLRRGGSIYRSNGGILGPHQETAARAGRCSVRPRGRGEDSGGLATVLCGRAWNHLCRRCS